MTSTAGWLLVAGALLFLTAAFSPSSFVFGMRDPAAQREFLANHATSWRWGQIPFAGGAVVSAVGLIVLGKQVHSPAIVVAGALATLASLPWVEHCRQRALSWARFLDGDLPGWHFPVYAWGTLAALAATGVVLRHCVLPQWTGWFTLAATAVFTAFWVTAKNLPPFLFYLVTGVLGVVAI